jgi:beta-1,4-galactosyltransferase 3
MNMDGVTLADIEHELAYLNLKPGGVSNKNRTALYKTAIVVPYKDRLKNLQLFLRNIHPFLDKQNIFYAIYVVEPVEGVRFNKGVLMNVGFLKAFKDEQWDCVIFHDVDLLPENEKNLYMCDQRAPKAFAIAVSSFLYE